MVRLAVHVTPRSPAEAVAGWRGGELELRVSAPPEDGKANRAACALVAGVLGVPKSNVRVVRGESSRHKMLEIDGIAEKDLFAAFGSPDAALF